MDSTSRSRFRYRRTVAPSSTRASLAVLGLLGLCSTVFAAEKPLFAPDAVAPFSADSRISATIEFSLRALATEIEKEIPRRLATIDERISCVHRRVLIFRVNANCDIRGYVERSGPVSLYGRGNRLYGSVPIYGALEGQGANRFTARIRGETEASATVEAEARPQLRPDWSLDLDFSDGFRWSEPPILHVLGREISLASHAEPRIRTQLAHIRSRVLSAVQRLDLRDKAATAWRHAFDPIELFDSPVIWLQLTPRSAAFAGVRADAKVLRGSLELAGSAETFVGQRPPPVTVTALPSLDHDVSEPGKFEVILPVRIGYDVLKDRIKAIAALASTAEISIRDVEVYPSSGKLVVGLDFAKASDPDPSAGQWVYLTAALDVRADGHAVRISDFDVTAEKEKLPPAIASIVMQLRDQVNIDYGVAYQNLLEAANERLTRPLKNGFRMEGHLSSATLEKLFLPADGVVIGFRANGNLTILYGM